MKVAFQGVLGAYSHLAAKNIFPQAEYRECETFPRVLEAVKNKEADYAVIPVENSNAGRVADVHFLLPETGLFIIGEHFFKVRHQLWGLKGSKTENIKMVYSHPQALSQCSKFLTAHGIQPGAQADTALSCRLIKELNNPEVAAIASEAAGELYGLNKLAANIENAADNTTRFLIMTREALPPELWQGKTCKTSLVFKVKNIHSALYHALKCFADEALNLAKIESYMFGDTFESAQFYVEIYSASDTPDFKRAMKALDKVCESIHFLGTYFQR